MAKKQAAGEPTDMLKGTLDMLILQTLAPGAAHGHTIAHVIERRSEDVLLVEHGSLYPALHRLEKSELVEGKWQTLASGQQRKYYHITEKGSATLAEKRSSWVEFLTAMNLIIQIEGGR